MLATQRTIPGPDWRTGRKVAVRGGLGPLKGRGNGSLVLIFPAYPRRRKTISAQGKREEKTSFRNEGGGTEHVVAI